jgi:hypothetical protein
MIGQKGIAKNKTAKPKEKALSGRNFSMWKGRNFF